MAVLPHLTAMWFLIVIVCVAPLHAAIDPGRCLMNLKDTSWQQQMSPTTAELLDHVTDSCHYDNLKPPPTDNGAPLKVFIKTYFYFLKSYEAHNLQFTVYMLLQCRFHDPRLAFDPVLFNTTTLVGTREVSARLWTPHLYFHNERKSLVMGPGERDVMAHIFHDGTVLYTKRIQTTLFCWMKLQKFPFDSQDCSLVLDSWSYNMTYLTLHWEANDPILCREELTLTEFSLVGDPVASYEVDDYDFDKGDFQGNYSSLVVTFHLQREWGFYVYDYFIPSIMLVVMSWVSFWLEADGGVSGRVVLGCIPMLTFIILALQTGNSLPKVSYFKASEIWFLGCTAFIFGSLVEFAFVNTIWRSRRQKIELKKVNSKYILMQTLTPKVRRKEASRGFERSTSCPYDMNVARGSVTGLGADLFINSGLHKTSLPNVNLASTSSAQSEPEPQSKRSSALAAWFIRRGPKTKGPRGPTLMTPHEISNWIDQRSRVVFPISFLVFNAIYWSYIYCM